MALSVALCIATYRRPAQLAALLDALARLDTADAGGLVVAVVDNDAAASARAIVDAARAALPFPVVYDVEPERNISLARNRSVRLALERGAEWLAFIDDDEVPRREWLAELLRVQRATGAEVVTGPVIAHLPEETPRWLRGAFSRDRHLPDGTPVPIAETANALVSRRVIDEMELRPPEDRPAGRRPASRRDAGAPGIVSAVEGPFEPEFGLSGGGDTRFFLRARLGGARIVWAAGAVVEEDVPPSRVRLGWLLRRAYREGNASAFVERGVLPLARWVPRRVAAACAHFVLGLGLTPFAPVRGLRLMANAVGSLAGTLGIRYFEYR
ncbi:MAG TPA: glycosyltransferase [Thermoanaerobaculia bacterium]